MSEIIENAQHQILNEKPDLRPSAIYRYFKSRIPTLFDIPFKNSEKTLLQTLNPFPGLKELNSQQWNFYFLGFFAWTVDSFDFFCVSVAAPLIAELLRVSITEVSWGVTLALMFRSLGAVIFGMVTDYYGRKYPYLLLCVLFVIVEIGTGFVTTYGQFLGVRAVFGLIMGGMYSVASCNALEDQPQNARSILSGLFLPGYNFAYALASAFYRAFEDSYKPGQGWRALFWFSAGLPVILFIWRLFYPETNAFLRLKRNRELINQAKRQNNGAKTVSWIDSHIDRTIWLSIKTEWIQFIYLVLLMLGFNFMSHGSQDLYPTLLEKQRDVGSDAKTVIMVVVNLGAMAGGVVFGQLTEVFGRRLTIVVCVLFSACFLYPSYYSNHVPTIIGGFFFLNFGVMGAWGVAPLHLIELVNANHRSFLSGLVYQLGNLVSSASITIEAQLGTKFPIESERGNDIYNYGLVMLIFCGAVFAYMLVIVPLGPERFHRDITLGESEDEIVGGVGVGDRGDRDSARADSDIDSIEKTNVAHHEKV